MRVEIAGRHMEVTEALRTHVEQKLDKLRGHFDRVIDVEVVLIVEKHRHIAEITLHANGIRIHSAESSDDMYLSVDAAVEKLEKQIRKFKNRINRSQSRRAKGPDAVGEYLHNVIELNTDEAGESADQEGSLSTGHRIILREKLPMKPMSVEEAMLQLDLADDNFLVFSNADTQQVNVVYARDDGTFGLVEPQF